MKKLMWGVSLFSLVITAIALQFMPDSVPMHYDLAGNIDRWGSKYENLLFPGIILLLSFFWHCLIAHYEKKAAKAPDEKKSAEALANAKVLKIVGVVMAAIFTVEQLFILYSAYREAREGAAKAYIDIGKVSCILLGILFLILGNFMPKTRKNAIAGVRVSWSVYNDTTWRKSNRFGGAALMAAGAAVIVTSVFVRASMAVVLSLVYILGATVVTLLYSRSVYKEEISKKEKDG